MAQQMVQNMRLLISTHRMFAHGAPRLYGALLVDGMRAYRAVSPLTIIYSRTIYGLNIKNAAEANPNRIILLGSPRHVLLMEIDKRKHKTSLENYKRSRKIYVLKIYICELSIEQMLLIMCVIMISIA